MTIFYNHDFTHDADGTTLASTNQSLQYFFASADTSDLMTVTNGVLKRGDGKYGIAWIDCGTVGRRLKVIACSGCNFTLGFNHADNTATESFHVGFELRRPDQENSEIGFNMSARRDVTPGQPGDAYSTDHWYQYDAYAGNLVQPIHFNSLDDFFVVDLEVTTDGYLKALINNIEIRWAFLENDSTRPDKTLIKLPPYCYTTDPSVKGAGFGIHVDEDYVAHGADGVFRTIQGRSDLKSIIVRDLGNNTTILRSVKKRFDTTRSSVIFTVQTNAPGITSYHIDITNPSTGLVIATASGAADPSLTTTLTSTAIPAELAGVQLSAKLTTNLNDPEQEDTFLFTGPFTAIQRPLYLGWNAGGFIHYNRISRSANVMNGSYCFVDYTALKLPWMDDADPYGSGLNGSIVGMQSNGWPTKFSDDHDNIGFEMPWLLQPWMINQYFELDMRQQPGLVPEIVNFSQGKRKLDLNYFGAGRHRVYMEDCDHSTHTIIDDDNWFIRVNKSDSTFIDPSTLPAEGWAPVMRLVGDTGNKLYSPDVFTWQNQLGHGIRYMTDQYTNEPYQFTAPVDYLTPERLIKADGAWTTAGTLPHYTIEYAAQLANDTNTWMWWNIGRFYSIELCVYFINWLKTNYPNLHVVFQFSNETWNFSFAQQLIMGYDGFRRGLGKDNARYGQNDNLPIPEVQFDRNPPSGGYQALNNGDRVIWNGLIFELTGTQDVTKTPDDAASGFTFEQGLYPAQQRWMSERVRAIADAMKVAAGDSLWGSRYMLIVDTWQITNNFIEPCLKWGPMDADGNVIDPLGKHIHGVCSATYFGDHVAWKDPLPGQGNGSGVRGTPQSILTANPGADRQAAMLAQTYVEMYGVIEQWSNFQTYLAKLNTQYGWNLEGMCYEGGLSFETYCPMYDANGDTVKDSNGRELADQSWFEDRDAMVRSDGMRQLTREWWVAIAQEAGGHICGFDADTANFIGDHNDRVHETYSPGCWGISEYVNDYSARYNGLIDASKDLLVYNPSNDNSNENDSIVIDTPGVLKALSLSTVTIDLTTPINGTVAQIFGTSTPPPVLISGTPAAATVGSSAVFKPLIEDAAGGLSLSVVAGALPPGRSVFHLHIMGKYVAAGTFTYTLRVTDVNGTTADLIVTETVS